MFYDNQIYSVISQRCDKILSSYFLTVQDIVCRIINCVIFLQLNVYWNNNRVIRLFVFTRPTYVDQAIDVT